jgi:hypothetical protein
LSLTPTGITSDQRKLVIPVGIDYKTKTLIIPNVKNPVFVSEGIKTKISCLKNSWLCGNFITKTKTFK